MHEEPCVDEQVADKQASLSIQVNLEHPCDIQV